MNWDAEKYGKLPEAVREYECFRNRTTVSTQIASHPVVRQDKADAAIAELMESVALWTGRFEGATLRAEQAEAEVAARKTYDAEVVEPRLCELEAEVARLKWMLREAISEEYGHVGMDDEYYEQLRADLAARYEEEKP